MRTILSKDYNVLQRIVDDFDPLIDRSLEVWDGITDDWDLWRPVYDIIFSEDVSGVIYTILRDFDPYIPDTTYQEDVCSFWMAFKQVFNNLETV